MRRPGNLAGANYWFGSIDRVGKIKKSFADEKLAEIMGAMKKNSTPLTSAQQKSRLRDVLNGAKPGNITG